MLNSKFELQKCKKIEQIILEAVYGVLRAGCWPGLARRWRLSPPQIECWCAAMQDTQHFDDFAGLNKHLTTVQIGLRAAAGLLGRCASWNAPVGACVHCSTRAPSRQPSCPPVVAAPQLPHATPHVMRPKSVFLSDFLSAEWAEWAAGGRGAAGALRQPGRRQRALQGTAPRRRAPAECPGRPCRRRRHLCAHVRRTL